ncbi:hypothetical protein TNCV_4137481 [Trichonephila clavipes]|nr:hypothetical protein TNCV_4137481 [Trichonephila clavipes]
MRGGRPLTHPQGILPQNWDGIVLNRTVTCLVPSLSPTTGVHLAPCYDEFLGPRSDYVRQIFRIKDFVKISATMELLVQLAPESTDS